MIFKRIQITNFMSIKNITLDLDGQGLVLINGVNRDNPSARSNGAGKSSIIESLVYAVYGRTLRGIKGDAVVNRSTGNNMKIFLDIVDDDGTEYRIARYRKHHVNHNKSILYCNGKDITPKSEADFNNAVADLFQADYLTFTSSLLYSAESFKFTSSTDAEMKSTFDTMLGLEVFTKCLEIVRNRLRDVQGELSNSEYKISTLQEKIDSLQQQIESNEVSKQDFETEQAELIASIEDELKSLNDDLSDAEKSKKQHDSDLNGLNKKLKKAQSEVDKAKEDASEVGELQEALSDVKSDIDEDERKQRRLKKEIDDCEDDIICYESKIEKAKETIEKLEQKRDDLDSGIGKPCPTCGQPLTKKCIEPAKVEYNQKIAEQKESISSYSDKIQEIQDTIKSKNDELDSLKSEIEQLEEDKETFEAAIENSREAVDKVEECEKKVREIERSISGVESDIRVDNNNIKSLEKQINRTSERIEEEKSKKNPYESVIDQLNENIKKSEDEIKDVKDSIEDTLDTKECLLFWEEAYSNQGIKSFILDDITPFLNKRANKYLKKLASNHIEVVFSTQTKLKSGEMREKFSLEVNNLDGGKDYIANSSGEKRRVDLAVNLALQDLVASRSSKKINIAIFDEAFDSLDDVGIENVIDVLQGLSNEKSSIFVISHNHHLKSYFTNILTVVKEDGCSKLSNQTDEDENSEEEGDSN